MSSSRFSFRKVVDRAMIVALFTAVVFTTLAFGTVDAWSVAIFQLIIVVLLLLWAVKAIVEKRLEIKMPAAALPLAGFVLVGGAQSVAITGVSGETTSLSMDVEATRGAAAMIFFLFVAFLGAVNLFQTRERLSSLANFLIVFGLLLAVFAMVQHFTWEGKMYWVRPTPSAGEGLGGPFVNKNHFAGYMEMLIPIPLALALTHAVRGEGRLFYAFAALIMSIAAISSLSRGGMVSLASGFIFLAAIRALHHRDASSGTRGLSLMRQAFLIVGMLFAIGVGIIWIGADFDILRRLANDPMTTNLATDRRGVWGDTLTMFTAHPILGIGLGAFETVYPIYGRADGSFIIQFAHNDYLQVLSDGGLVGGALALAFIIVVFRSFAIGLRSRDPWISAFALGAGSGIFAILVHSLFDFNLQIPSNALLFLVLCAVVSTIGVSSKSRDVNGAPDEPKVRSRTLSDENPSTTKSRWSRA